MRAFVQRSLTCAIIGLAAWVAGPVLAQQPVEEPEELVVRGKSPNQYRVEIELAQDEMFRLFNEANEGDDNDVRCRYEVPTGSRIPTRVCWSASQDRASATAGRDFLQGLTADVFTPSEGSETGIGSAQNAADGESHAMIAFADEWRRLMGTNQQFHEAVVEYRELQNELNRARGTTIRVPIPVFALKGPQCEASTYTEYEQRGNVARVSGTVSISSCPAGTTGKFALVASVRNEAGAITPIEFSETWQRADAQDHIFSSAYPIGDNVFLENVRIRNLTCTCEGPAR